MLFWEERTATPLPTHRFDRMSSTLGSRPNFSSSEMMTCGRNDSIHMKMILVLADRP